MGLLKHTLKHTNKNGYCVPKKNTFKRVISDVQIQIIDAFQDKAKNAPTKVKGIFPLKL